jgi:hypothetical protein
MDETWGKSPEYCPIQVQVQDGKSTYKKNLTADAHHVTFQFTPLFQTQPIRTERNKRSIALHFSRPEKMTQK